jgi:DNA polymerase-3 subunit delta'
MSWSRIEGQPLAVRMIAAHVRRGRLPSAYLFAGPDGVGKQLAAREYAKALNCLGGPAGGGASDTSGVSGISDAAAVAVVAEQGGCGQCRPCVQIERGVWPDLPIAAPGSSGAIKLDDLRAAFERVHLRPFAARVQVAVILDADRLTDESANSLLKTLEEPPSATRFVLTTTEPAHCLPTIVSRCQVVRFRPLAASVIERLLRAGDVDAETAAVVAPMTQGSLARARQLAAQWPAHRARCEQLAAGDAGAWLGWTQPEERRELADWLGRSVWWLRDVSVAGVARELPLQHGADAEAIRLQAERLDARRCVEAGMRLVHLWDSLEQMANPRLVATAFRDAWLGLVSTRAAR